MSSKQAILIAVQAMADDATDAATRPVLCAWPPVSSDDRAVMEAGPLSNEEIARRGEAVYESDLRAAVEPEHLDEVIAIDIASGTYAHGASVLEAAARLRASRPDAIGYCRRVGPRPLRSFGWFPRRRA